MTNGLYFLNCFAENQVQRSGIAFYTDITANNGNVDEQPSAFVYTNLPGNTFWEEGSEKNVTFADSTTLTWTISTDAAFKQQGEVVGSAYNGFQRFTICKDKGTHVFWNNDGYDCKRIYYAVAN